MHPTRHPEHALSNLVLEAKDDADKAAQVAEIFALLAGRPSWRASAPGLVVSVPPTPGSDFDRFAAVRAMLAVSLDARDGEGMLAMNFTVDDYKRLPHDARRAANEGRFRAARLSGEQVLLIDDVLTSGGQVEAGSGFRNYGFAWKAIHSGPGSEFRKPLTRGCTVGLALALIWRILTT